MRAVRSVAALVCVSAMVAACGSSTKHAASPTTASGKPASSSSSPEKTVTVGVIADLSGAAANVNESVVQGVKAGVGRAATEGYKVNVVYADGATNPSTVLAAAHKLVEQDHVFAVIAEESLLFAAAPYLHSKGIPVVGAAIDGPEWNTDDNMFSIYGYEGDTKVETTIGQILKLLGATNLATIGYSISPSSADTAKSYAASAQHEGLKAGYVNANVPFGTTNVAPYVLAMKQAGIDAFYPLTDTTTGVATIVGLRQQGVDLKVGFLPESEGDLLASGPTTEQEAKGLYFTSAYEPPEMNTPATQAIASDLRTYAGVSAAPTLAEYIGYLSIDGLVTGLKAAGNSPTQASFIQTMEGITNYDAAGLFGSHSISFAPANRGSGGPGADDCTWVTQWNGSSFTLIKGADPICGSTIPGASA